MALFSDRFIKPDKPQNTKPPEKTVAPTRPAVQQAEPASDLFNADGRYTAPPAFKQVREELQQFLLDEVKSLAELGGIAQLRQMLEPVFNKGLADAHLVVSR